MVTETIKKIYGLVAELEKQYPGRHFTPDQLSTTVKKITCFDRIEMMIN